MPAALMDSTAQRRSALLWKSFTMSCRLPVATLPSMRMYLHFVLGAGMRAEMGSGKMSGCGRNTFLLKHAIS